MTEPIDWTPPAEAKRPPPEANGVVTQSHARRLQKRLNVHEWRRDKLTKLADELQRTNNGTSINTALKILRITASVPPTPDDE